MLKSMMLRTTLAALLGSSSFVSVALAQSHSVAVPAGALITALKSLAQQVDVDIVYQDEQLKRFSTNGVSGNLSPREAVGKLLEGTNLRLQTDEQSGAILITAGRGDSRAESRSGSQEGEWRLAQYQTSSAAASSTSQSVRQSDESTVEGVTVFATLDQSLSVGSKSGTSLRETPKSITVLTGERIQAQNLTSLQEALVQTTGITVGAFSPLDTFYYSRGIKMETLQFDGGAPAYTGGLGFFYTPDTATIERVEVLRGVDGMYSGAGEPGGVINLVRKRAQETSAVQLSLSGGTWDNYRGILDVTGPLALDGRLRGRAVASYMDRGYHIDRYTTEKEILYGTLEMDVTESTVAAVGVSYEKRDDDAYPGWSGVPRYSDGRRLQVSREFNPAPDWSRWHFETQEIFGRVEQHFGESGVIRLNVNQIDQDSKQKQALVYGSVNPVTLLDSRIYGSQADYSSRQSLADLSASGKVELFGLSHSYTVGMDYTKLDGAGQRGYTMSGFGYGDNVVINYFNYNPALIAEPASVVNSDYPVREQWQTGIYATVGLQLAQPLRLTLGGRQGKYHYNEVYRPLPTGTPSKMRYDDSQFIPSAALSYSLSDSWTSYVSYGETFKSQGSLLQGPLPGTTPLDPIVGDNVELGIKGDIFDGVTAAASIYKLTRDGQGTVDRAYLAVTNPENGSRCCYIEQGDITVKGADLEMSGLILPGWQLFGGYTFSETEFVGTPTGASNLGRTPKHMVKAWSTFRLPGRFSPVTLNGGVVSQSTAYYGTFAYGGYTLFNASVQYELNDHWSVAVFADNLTDKVYWQPTGALDNQNIYGTPRSLTLTIRGRM